jgi:hypothetical protein
MLREVHQNIGVIQKVQDVCNSIEAEFVSSIELATPPCVSRTA